MKLTTKLELQCLKIAVFHIILGSLPQLWLAWQFYENGYILDRISIHPGITLLVICLPGIIWKRITFRIACFGINKEDRDVLSYMWSEVNPKLLWLPIFQMHSGIFFIFKFTIILIVRLFAGAKEEDDLWRLNTLYLINEPA